METVQAKIALPIENPNWMELFAHKTIAYDQMMNQATAMKFIIEKLAKLYTKWTDESLNVGYFMPDKEGDKIARTRTGACAEEMHKILRGGI